MKGKLRIILAVLITLAVVGGLIFACLEMSKERATENGNEKPAADSRVKRAANGEVTLTLDSETQLRIALKVEAMKAAQMQPELKGYGRVLDPAPLAALVSEVAAALVTAQASRQEFERLKLLSEQNNASTRALQSAQATANRDQLLAESLRTRLTLTWCKALADRDDLPGFVQSLTTRENALIRIDLPAGEPLQSPPVSARLVSLAGEEKPVDAEFFDKASNVDPQTQGQGFLFLVKGKSSGLPPGAAATGYLKLPGAPMTGVIVPRMAVVRFNGKAWVYLQTDDKTFTRRDIALDHPTESGWFISSGFNVNDRIVTSGPQMLLSEELNSANGTTGVRD